MEVIHERCAGLDVHKETVVGCVRLSERGAVCHEVRRFTTTTAGLLELADWLRQAGCTHVAMEATGVYWKPVWHILEGEFELVLPTRPTSATCRGAKATTTMRPGSQTCWRTG
jgi:transposase